VSFYRVSGYSMRPFLRSGDRIIVAAGPVKKGDLLVFRQGENIVCHRLIAISPDGKTYFLRGDCSPSAAEPVPRNAVTGRVVTVVKNGGALRDMDKNPWAAINRVMPFIVPVFALWYSLFSRAADMRGVFCRKE